MERLPISESTIKEILKNRIKMIESIHARIEYLNKDISQTSDIIEAVSLRSKTLSDMPRGSSGHKDLHTEYERYHILLDKRYVEYARGIHQLVLQEERIERVWLCFNALDSDAYTTLYKLYVENQLYQTVELESGLTHPVFEKKRKRAMQDIIRLYDSDFKNGHIFEHAEMERNNMPKVKEEAKQENNHQLSLMDVFMTKEGENGA